MNNKNIWQEKAIKEAGENFTALYKNTLEDIDIEPVYFAKDDDDQSVPGEYPFKRGIRATMYAHRPWTIRQYAGFASAKESNNFYKQCLKMGQKGLSIAFDLPTHRGLDSDDEKAKADVGQAGVAIDTIEDMKILFSGIDLGEVSVSMTMNGAVIPILAAYIGTAIENGVSIENLKGTIQNDILKEFLVRNTYIYPPKESMRITRDIIIFLTSNMPKFNSISISGYHLHEAGADLALELALTICNGKEYVKLAKEASLNIDDFAAKFSFFFATGMNFFMEVAKLRAARVLWAEIMKEEGAKSEKTLLLRTHCQTSGWSLTAQDPYNNIIRTTIEAMAAALGGTQSLHTNSFDEAIALPTVFSSSIARNTQLILQKETKICDVVDPLGGSYYVEELTTKMIEKAKIIIDQIREQGGMIEAIKSGFAQRLVEKSAIKRQALIDSNQEQIVGVNCFQNYNEDSEVDALSIDSTTVSQEQLSLLKKVRASRNEEKVQEGLHKIKKACQNENENILQAAIEAMLNRATVGEVSKAIGDVYGFFTNTYQINEGIYIKTYGDPNKTQAIRQKAKNFEQRFGRRPRILIAKMGQDGHDRGAKVIASAFADLGFDVDISPLFQSPKSIARQAIDNDVHVIGVSSLAAGHKINVPKLMQELSHNKATDKIVIVGGVVPKKDFADLYKQGVKLILGPGTSALLAADKILSMLSNDG